MPKKINIIARSNGVGLDSDVSLLTHALEHAGHNVTFSHCRSRSFIKKWFSKKHRYDANIFLERIFPVWFGAAKMNILIPNQERFPTRHLKRLKKIDYVLCKTKHAEEIFSKYTKTKYISFTSKDIHLNDQTPNYDQFFHLAGRSTLKGTEVILKLWKRHPEWPLLTIVQHQENAPKSIPSNVRLITDYLPFEELTKLANKNGIHLCPSLSEGWGHYIVEAMSCSALVITTNAPPMNELINNNRGLTVNYVSEEPRHLGTNFYIDPDLLEQTIKKVINLTNDQKQALGTSARDWFTSNHQQFNDSIDRVIKSIL